MARCSNCGGRLEIGPALPGIPTGTSVLMGGDALNAMATRLAQQPRACVSCQRNFCSRCASHASTKNRFACPKCRRDLGELDSRATFIQGAPCDASIPIELHILQHKRLSRIVFSTCLVIPTVWWFWYFWSQRVKGSLVAELVISALLGTLVGCLLMVPVVFVIEIYLRIRGR